MQQTQLEKGDVVVLYGDESIINEAVAKATLGPATVEVVGTTQTIEMDESPVDAVRSKQDSSLVVMCKDGSSKAEKPLDAVISAGNTGAFVAGSQMHLRRLEGVHRPGIAAAVPTFAGTVAFIDVGANIEPKPVHLAQYGVMGKVYAKRILGIDNPRVALMNVGGEEQKGTSDLKEAREMLRAVPDLNFVGYIEGRSLFDGGADVVITDGYRWAMSALNLLKDLQLAYSRKLLLIWLQRTIHLQKHSSQLSKSSTRNMTTMNMAVRRSLASMASV